MNKKQVFFIYRSLGCVCFTRFKKCHSKLGPIETSDKNRATILVVVVVLVCAATFASAPHRTGVIHRRIKGEKK